MRAAADPVNDVERWDDEVGGVQDQIPDTGYFASAATGDGRSFEVRHLDRIDADALDRRRQLWRDTAILLSGLVAVLLVANLVVPQIAGLAAASPSPLASGITGGPSPSAQGAAGPTEEPILDPGLGIDATPTPVPVITLPPTGTSPPATHRPVATPKPTKRPPTPPPPTEVPTPEPTPEVTPPPAAPHAIFDCTPDVGLVLSCAESSTDAASWAWDWGDGTQDTGSNPGPHTYASDLSPVTVTLTVTGPGGADTTSHAYTLLP